MRLIEELIEAVTRAREAQADVHRLIAEIEAKADGRRQKRKPRKPRKPRVAKAAE